MSPSKWQELNKTSCLIIFSANYALLINVRENRSGNQNWKIQRNWQRRVHKTTKNKTNFTQANTNNVNKTWAFLQTTGIMLVYINHIAIELLIFIISGQVWASKI
jgi:hypothetical protein